nr:hypothetical protein [Curtobacterium sp. MCBD17_008]
MLASSASRTGSSYRIPRTAVPKPIVLVRWAAAAKKVIGLVRKGSKWRPRTHPVP